MARLVQSEFYRVQPWDSVSTGVAALSVLAVAGLAGYLPARRATVIDPIHALRFE